MAEVMERDQQFVRELYWDEAAEQVAAYRERCVAEERAAREKAEARLRAVIEAADMLVNCVEAHEAHAWHETYRCKDGVCICGLKKMQTHLDNALATYRRVRDAQASPKPEASKQVGGTAFCVDLGAVLRGEARPADHAFHWRPDNDATHCALPGCGLPWSKHGERDAR